MNEIANNLRAAAVVLLDCQEHVQTGDGMAIINLHKRADEMNEAADEIDRLAGKVDSLATCEAWLQKQVAERDATIESLRLKHSQEIADMKFALRQVMDQRDIFSVQASQLRHLLDM